MVRPPKIAYDRLYENERPVNRTDAGKARTATVGTVVTVPTKKLRQRITGEQHGRRPRQRPIESRAADQQPCKAGHHRQACADAIADPAKRRAADRERQRRDAVGGKCHGRRDVNDLRQIGRREQDHDEDPGRQHPRQRQRQHRRGAMFAEHRYLQRDLARQRTSRGQFPEHRRLFEKPSQVDRDKTEPAPEHKRQPPPEPRHVRRAEHRVDAAHDQRSEQNPHRQSGGQRADGHAKPLDRHVLGDEDPRPGPLANRGALQNPHQQEQHRRGVADRSVGGEEADGQRRHRHQEDTEGEHPLAPEKVAEVPNQDAADGARQIARGEDAERLRHPQPVRHVLRKKQQADDRRKEDINDEVVELQCTAERGEGQCSVVASVQRPLRFANDVRSRE